MKNEKDRIHSLTSLEDEPTKEKDLSTSKWQRLVVPILWAIEVGLVALVIPAFGQSRELARSLSLGPMAIHYYGIILATAVFTAICFLTPLIRHRFQDDTLLDRLLIWILPFAFIGARLYFVIFSWDEYASHWQSIFAIWEGGLAIHGGILGGLIGILIALALENKKGKSIPFIALLDIIAPVLALGQAIGRWGNFVNQEAFGRPTMLPWKMFVDPAFRPIGFLDQSYFHPTFLYESLGTLLIFSIIWLLMTRRSWAGMEKLRPGTSLGIYLVGYGILRFIIEGLRTDSLMAGSFRVAQFVSLIFVTFGIILLVRSRKINSSTERAK